MTGLATLFLDPGPMIALAAGIFIASAGLFMVLADVVFGGTARRRRQRLETVATRWSAASDGPAAPTQSLRQDTALSSVPGLDRLLRQVLPRPEALRRRLIRTGLKMTLGAYLLSTVTLMAALTTLIAFGFGFPLWLAVVCGISFGCLLSYLVVGRIIARRESKFIELLPEAIDLMVRGLKSGLPIAETIAIVGGEMRDPVGQEFRLIAQSIRLGETVETAVIGAVERIDLPELKFFATALSVQRETGGNLAETLANLSDILRKRRQMKLKVRAMSSEARYSAMIIGSLPFIMFGIIYAMSPDYAMVLFNDPRGMIVVGIALFLMAIGVGVMMKMVRFEI